MVETMGAEKGEMVEDMYLDASSGDNMGIEYWSAENVSIGLSSVIKTFLNRPIIPNPLHRHIISISYLRMHCRITRIGILTVAQLTM